jgi:catechol 2,3-dioxygenase-like lactoylglutathione lyase family enzyme
MDKRQVDHVTINVANADAVRDFYRSALGKLGLSESVDPRGRVEYGRDGQSDFGFYADPREFYQRAHVAFAATSREEVDRFYAAAVSHGGSPLDPPKERIKFGLYSAYVSDPEGNGVEVACPLAQS